MNYPNGKTPAQLTKNINQSDLKELDLGYIDGYVQAADSRPYALFVREDDGLIDMVPVNCVKALFDS